MLFASSSLHLSERFLPLTESRSRVPPRRKTAVCYASKAHQAPFSAEDLPQAQTGCHLSPSPQVVVLSSRTLFR